MGRPRGRYTPDEVAVRAAKKLEWLRSNSDLQRVHTSIVVAERESLFDMAARLGLKIIKGRVG